MHESWSLSCTVKNLVLDGQFTLGALYSMEQQGIPVLTELIDNSSKLGSMVCSAEIDENSNIVYKWPTLHFPSLHQPTWEKLCSILQSSGRKDLAEAVRGYLKNGCNLKCT